jgi:hypothetical protein
MSESKPSYTVEAHVKDDTQPNGLRREHFHIKAWGDASAITEAQSAVTRWETVSYEVRRETKMTKSVIYKSLP